MTNTEVLRNTDALPAAAQRQALVKVSGIPGYFARRTGGNVSADSTPVWEGGRITPDQLGSPAVTENITVGRPYRPGRDRDVLRDMKRVCGRWRTTVSEQDTDAEFVAVGKPFVWSNALLVGVNVPETDAASGDPKSYELVFAVENPGA